MKSSKLITMVGRASKGLGPSIFKFYSNLSALEKCLPAWRFAVVTLFHSEFGFIFANSITLTPGTTTMRIEDDTLLVHTVAREVGEDLLKGDMDRRVTRMEGHG